jgi:hypothetical protein
MISGPFIAKRQYNQHPAVTVRGGRNNLGFSISFVHVLNAQGGLTPSLPPLEGM